MEEEKKTKNNQNIPLLQNGETGCPQDGTEMERSWTARRAEKEEVNLLTSAVHFNVHIKYGNVFLNILETVLKILGVNNGHYIFILFNVI